MVYHRLKALPHSLCFITLQYEFSNTENRLSSTYKFSHSRFVCHSWCYLCALSLGTWYLFWEVAAEDSGTPNGRAKAEGGVKTENNDHVNLKVVGQDGSVVSKLMENYCEWQGLSKRSIRFWFDGHPIKEMDTYTAGNGGGRYNLCVLAAYSWCLLKREPTT